MKRDIFAPADILLPKNASMEKWSIIACDQFTSERDYWERVSGFVNGAPSALNLVLPEVYLDGLVDVRIRKISEAMADYVNGGIFTEYKDSFVYVERTLQDGRMRRGLVGAADLEEYEFSGDGAAILASEGTVRERLPVRVDIRRGAMLEIPHIMSFIDDKDKTVIEPLTKKAEELPLLYDFDLMEGGGHIKGMQVSGSDAGVVMEALRSLREKNRALLVIGDGNHALAAAKVYWDELKQGLSKAERENHPARRALIEVNNVYEQAITFEAIHRVIYNTDAADLITELEKAIPAGNDYVFGWRANGKSGTTGISADCIGDALTVLHDFLEDYAARTGCVIDYIHGEQTATQLSRAENCVALILPAMEKTELFATVTSKGVFPKKSFSVGSANDKRYYLECRRIRG